MMLLMMHSIGDATSRLLVIANAPAHGIGVEGHVTELDGKAAVLSVYFWPVVTGLAAGSPSPPAAYPPAPCGAFAVLERLPLCCRCRRSARPARALLVRGLASSPRCHIGCGGLLVRHSAPP